MTQLTYKLFDDIFHHEKYLRFLVKFSRKSRYPFLDVDWSTVPYDSLLQYLLKSDRYSRRIFLWIILKGDAPIGVIEARINKITDKHILTCNPYIIKDERGNGYALESIDYVLKYLNENSFLENIRRFHVDTNSIHVPNGLHEYLANIGFEINYRNRTSGADLRQYDWDKISKQAEKLKQLANSKGYTFRYMINGVVASLQVDKSNFFKMREIIWNDMPSEDANWEYEPYNDKIHNEHYETTKHGNRAIAIVSFDAENNPVGISEVWFNADVKYVLHQDDTGVIKKHRGYRLGKTMKLLLLQYVKDKYPELNDVHYWITGNAGSNTHMININNELNYEELTLDYCHEIDLEKFLNYLKTTNGGD